MKDQETSTFHVTESNKLEGLCHAFKALAFAKGKNPFAKRIVLVPSNAFKTFLKMDLANDFSISFGLNLFTYEEGLVHLAHLFLENEARRVPTILELTTRLQLELIGLVKNSADVHITRFLGGKFDGKVTTPIEKKLYFLAKNISRLFLNYGRFAEIDFQSIDENFQGFLFNKIFKEGHEWITRIDLLRKPLKEDLCADNTEVFVFAPFMTKEEVDFLKKISSKGAQIEVFSLTPSAYLLDDQFSDQEQARIDRKKSLPQHLFEKNSLLANYSLLFREMQKNIIDSTDSVSSFYWVEPFAEGFEEWNSLLQNEHFFVGQENPTLLKALQTDLTLMRIPKNKISIEEEKLSIEVHAASSRFREIEILHNQLLDLFTKNEKLQPMDIQVFAKDIALFEPCIKAIFGRKDSPLKYAILGEKTHPYSLIQAFVELLELSFKRFEALIILSLLEYPAFRNKWGISSAELQTIRSYIEEESFNWGEDLNHKNAIYRKRGFEKGSYDTLSKGTKEDFEARLIERLIAGDSPLAATSEIEIKDADTIASFLKLLNALSADLGRLSSNHPQTLNAWSAILQTLLETYFKAGDEDREAVEILQEKIASLAVIQETPCLFATPFQILKDALRKGAAREKEENLNLIRFSSLLPHHAMPGKVIALIGLEEGIFPGSDPHDSLNLLPKKLFIPKNSDTDRFLFMESVLAAKETLYLSYSAGEENAPSIVISDLFEYLDKAFTLNHEMPSNVCFFDHPKNRFHPRYFQENSKEKSYSHARFKEAAASLKARPEARSFICNTPLCPKKEIEKIDIAKLTSFLKYPLNAYLKASGIYVPAHSADADTHPFSVPYTTKNLVKKSYLKDFDESSFLSQVEKLPSMPPKLFRELHIKNMMREKSHAKEALNAFGLIPADLFTVNFLPYETTSVIQEFAFLHYGGIQIGDVFLFGKIENTSSKGLVRTLGKNKFKDMLPALFELSCAQKIFAVNALLFIGEEKNEVMSPIVDEQYLMRVVDIYREGLKRPLLLLPTFLKPLLEGNQELLEKEIEKAFYPYMETQEAEALKWAYGSPGNISAANLIADLQEMASVLLSPLSEEA